MSFLVWRFPSSFWMPLRGVASHAAERAWNGRPTSRDCCALQAAPGCQQVMAKPHFADFSWPSWLSWPLPQAKCASLPLRLKLCPGLLDSVSKTRSCRVTGKVRRNLTLIRGGWWTTWEMLTKRLSLRQFMLWVWPFRHDHLVLLLLHVSKMREIPKLYNILVGSCRWDSHWLESTMFC